MSADKNERWADVPGYDGLYQASTLGNVRRVLGVGKYQILKPFTRANVAPRMYRVRMTAPDGKRREHTLLSVIAATWCPPPPGMVVIHRNGMATDNTVENIGFSKKPDVLMKYAHRHNRKVVCKLDYNDEPVEFYQSITEAAKKNGMSMSAVSSHCNRRVKYSKITGDLMFRFDK